MLQIGNTGNYYTTILEQKRNKNELIPYRKRKNFETNYNTVL